MKPFRWWVGAACCAVVGLTPPMAAQDVVLPRVRVYAELTPPCDSALVANTAKAHHLALLPKGYACWEGIGGMMLFTARSDSVYAGILALRHLRRADSTLAVIHADRDESQPPPSFEDGDALVSWGLDVSRVQRAWDRGARGAEVKIGVWDTGFAIDHPAFAGRIVKCVFMDYLTVVDTVNACKQVNADCKQHGSHVASTIASTPYGGAPAALLVLMNGYTKTGGCGNYTSSRVAGYYWMQSQGVRVINVSTGSSAVPVETNAITALANAGIVVCGAAGNNASTTLLSPARVPGAFGITAMSSASGGIASYSNRDSTSDFAFPGSNILGVIGSAKDGLKSGTSMAAPHCAFTAALAIAEDPSLTVPQVYELFRLCARDIQTPGRDNASGWGHPRADCVVARARGESLQPTAATSTMTVRRGESGCVPVDSPVEWSLTGSVPGVTLTPAACGLIYTVAPDAPLTAGEPPTTTLIGVP